MAVVKKAAIPTADVGSTAHKLYNEVDMIPDCMHKKAEPPTGKNAGTSSDYTNFNEWKKDSLKIKPTSVEPIKVKIIDMGKGKPRRVSLE